MSKRTDNCALCGLAQGKIIFGKSQNKNSSFLIERLRLLAAITDLRAREKFRKASVLSWRTAVLTFAGILVTTGCLFWKSAHDDSQAKRGADVRIEIRIEACQNVTVVTGK